MHGTNAQGSRTTPYNRLSHEVIVFELLAARAVDIDCKAGSQWDHAELRPRVNRLTAVAVETAMCFIRANMPLGQPNTLTEQQAWDVSSYINSHPRPKETHKR